MNSAEDQFVTVFNAAPGGTSVSPTWMTQSGVVQGSLAMITDSTYNGTTGTVVLQGSNDNSNFAGVFQDDGVTAMSFTLATASTYTWEFKRTLFKFYKVVYTKGDATLGTISGDFIGKK